MPALPMGYRATELLGVGSSASVYHAIDARGREVALKVFGPQQRKHWLREVAANTSLKHDHIVTAVDIAYAPDGTCAIAYPLMRGNLADRLAERERFDAHEVRVVLRDVLCALEHIHRLGLIHGDVKPANVLCDDDGRYHLADLGSCGKPEQFTHRDDAGTPVYVAPERLGGVVRPTSDLYSVGVLAFELLVGIPPFHGDVRELLRQHLHTIPPFEALAASTLRPLVEHLLEKNPLHRSQTAFEALQRLQRSEGATPAAMPYLPPLVQPAPPPAEPSPVLPVTLSRVWQLISPKSITAVTTGSSGDEPLLLLDHGDAFTLLAQNGLTRRLKFRRTGSTSVIGSGAIVLGSSDGLWLIDLNTGRRRNLATSVRDGMAVWSQRDGKRWVWANQHDQVYQPGGSAVSVRLEHTAFQPRVALLPGGWMHAGGAYHDTLVVRDSYGAETATHRLDGLIVHVSTRGEDACVVTVRLGADSGWTLWRVRRGLATATPLPPSTTAIGAAGDVVTWVSHTAEVYASFPGAAQPHLLGQLPTAARLIQPSFDRRFITTIHANNEVMVWATA